MDRYFCAGVAPLVALMEADREAATERTDEPARPPAVSSGSPAMAWRRHPPDPWEARMTPFQGRSADPPTSSAT
jgi:hypothetical protein